jgi:hypothetical protein
MRKQPTALILCLSVVVFARTHAQQSADSHLGVYGKLSTYCGKQVIPRDPSAIPEFGCFYLSAGRGAKGTFATHRVEISVDGAGKEAFKVDGTLVVDTHDTATWTNLPYVMAGGAAGYSICEGPTDRISGLGCPSTIEVWSRNPDKTILFLVSECLPPEYRQCVVSQAGWDYAKSRRH